MPTALIIFSPPTLVPMPITALHSTISHTGMSTPLTLLMPLEKATPKNSTPINFWPSWAPCIKLMAAAPKISAPVKNWLVRRRSILRQRMVKPLQTTQPMQKPKARLATRP